MTESIVLRRFCIITRIVAENAYIATPLLLGPWDHMIENQAEDTFRMFNEVQSGTLPAKGESFMLRARPFQTPRIYETTRAYAWQIPVVHSYLYSDGSLL